MGPAPSPTISQNQEESHLVLRYQHWQMRGGDWVGDFNLTSGRYSNINNNHVLHQLQVVEKIVAMYRDNSVVVAITPGDKSRD